MFARKLQGSHEDLYYKKYCKDSQISCTFIPKNFIQNRRCSLSARPFGKGATQLAASTAIFSTAVWIFKSKANDTRFNIVQLLLSNKCWTRLWLVEYSFNFCWATSPYFKNGRQWNVVLALCCESWKGAKKENGKIWLLWRNFIS